MNIDLIKLQITELYEKNVEVHIDVFSTRPKININNAVAKITGVYKNWFRIEVVEGGLKKGYTVQYTDLFIGKVKIRELEKAL